ncbi:MAG: hypothetical protein ACRD0P_32475, partial [Stackebrandtia sp.]
LSAQLANWQGEAQKAFYWNFLTPYPNAVSNQTAVADELIVAISAYEAILHSARKDAKSIAENATKAVESFDGGKMSGAKSTFSIIGAAAGVIGAAVKGPAAGIVMALVSGSTDVGKDKSEEDGDEQSGAFEVSGGSPKALLESIRQNLTNLEQKMLAEEQGLAHALNADVGQVDMLIGRDGTGDSPTLIPHGRSWGSATPGPVITDANHGDDGPAFTPPPGNG